MNRHHRSSPAHSGIAIVGIGCRFPGGVSGPEEFWRLLVDGSDTVTEVPASRRALGLRYDLGAGDPGSAMERSPYHGAFLDTIDRFDNALFGISASEAEWMDPQQRLLLEVAWQALEDASIPAGSLRGRETGVFLGAMASDYANLLENAPESLEFSALNGAGRYGLAGGLSFHFEFCGPSLVVDTACSSSLLAVHLAAQSLRLGECEVALAGGVHLLLRPEISLALQRGGLLAADGRCRFGDATSAGFGRGEGAGLVVLKTIEQALHDGDRVYAVLRGSAVNHDGRSSDLLAAPSASAQRRLLQRVFRQSGVSAAEIDYIEAHGTGTRAGDRAELRALAEVFAERRDDPCRLGSVKTNIAHTEGAAGIAGLIKLALCLHHRELPLSLHGQDPRADLLGPDSGLRLQQHTEPWPDRGRALGGVNSFGLSGTNVHAVLEAIDEKAPQYRPERPATGEADLLVLSAASSWSLRALAERYLDFFQATSASLREVCRASRIGREPLPLRLAILGRTLQELRQGLRTFLKRPETELGGLLIDAPADEEQDRSLRLRAERFLDGQPLDQDPGEPTHRIPLPHYPFDRKSFWRPGSKSPGLVDAYDRLASFWPTGENGDPPEVALSFGLLENRPAEFSWTRAVLEPSCHARDLERVREAQKALRQRLFQDVDFDLCQRVLDIGCGHGTDLLTLARDYPHLEIVGYTLSPREAGIARRRICGDTLNQRVEVVCDDCTTVEAIPRFDCAFGIEVAHYIENKNELLDRLRKCLNAGGTVALADFVVRADGGIHHRETSSFLASTEEWVEAFSLAGLAITSCVDVSDPVARFLEDPMADESLMKLKHRDPTGAIGMAFKSHQQLHALLQKALASYVLIVARKQEEALPNLAGRNRNLLANALASPAIARQNGATRPDLGAKIRRILAETIELELAHLDDDTSLVSLGLDSLAAAELVYRLHHDLNLPSTIDAALPIDALLNRMTVPDLVQRVARLWSSTPSGSVTPWAVPS